MTFRLEKKKCYFFETVGFGPLMADKILRKKISSRKGPFGSLSEVFLSVLTAPDKHYIYKRLVNRLVDQRCRKHGKCTSILWENIYKYNVYQVRLKPTKTDRLKLTKRLPNLFWGWQIIYYTNIIQYNIISLWIQGRHTGLWNIIYESYHMI